MRVLQDNAINRFIILDNGIARIHCIIYFLSNTITLHNGLPAYPTHLHARQYNHAHAHQDVSANVIVRNVARLALLFLYS